MPPFGPGTACDLFVLDKADFDRILYDHQHRVEGVATVARDRYNLDLCAHGLVGYQNGNASQRAVD